MEKQVFVDHSPQTGFLGTNVYAFELQGPSLSLGQLCCLCDQIASFPAISQEVSTMPPIHEGLK